MSILRNERKQKGFTLVELMVVLGIFTILISIATYSMSKEIERAQEAQLKAMVKNITTEVYLNIYKYDLKHRWGKNFDTNYLNGKLETIMENKPYDNNYGHRNPYSGSKVILNWKSVPGKLRNPAVFITCNKKYAYDRIGSVKPIKPEKPSGVLKELRGSVIVWMNNNVSRVDIFYIDVEGRKSLLKNTVE